MSGSGRCSTRRSAPPPAESVLPSCAAARHHSGARAHTRSSDLRVSGIARDRRRAEGRRAARPVSLSIVDASDLLRGALLQMSDSDLVKSAVLKAPVSRSVVSRYVAGESVDEAVAVAAELRTTNRLATPRLPRRGHHRPGPGRGHPRHLRAPARGPRRGRPRRLRRRRGERQAQRRRPGPPAGRRRHRPRERPRHLRGRRGRRHHGHPRHGGPHHHRPHPRHPAHPARGLPVGRRRAAVLPAPHRGRLPRPRHRGQPGAAVQGRLQGAGLRRLPGRRPTSTCRTCAASRC